MEDYTDTATTYLTGWEALHWTLAIVGLAAAIAAPLLVLLLVRLAYRTLRNGAEFGWGASAVVVGLAGAAGMAILPGAIMRHIPQHEFVWFVVIPCLVAAAAWGIRGLGYTGWGWRAYTPAAILGIGTLAGAANDAITRAAASIPISVAGLVLLAILGAALLIGYSRR